MRKQAPSTTPSLSTPPATNNLPDARAILPTATSCSGSTYVAPHSLPSHVTQAAALLLQPQAERKRERLHHPTNPHIQHPALQLSHSLFPLPLPTKSSLLADSPQQMSRDRPVERCPECGSVYRMEYIGPPDDPHAHHGHGEEHHGYEEPKTFADYVRPEYRGTPQPHYGQT